MIGGGCFYMDTNKNELIVLNEQYGMTILPVEQEEFKGYKRIADSDFAKLNACFRDIDVISDEIGQYINTVKSLKANEVPANIMKSVGKVLELTRIPVVNPLFSYGAKGLGGAFDLGGDYFIKNEKSKKSKKTGGNRRS